MPKKTTLKLEINGYFISGNSFETIIRNLESNIKVIPQDLKSLKIIGVTGWYK